jgi:hypothetical protein
MSRTVRATYGTHAPRLYDRRTVRVIRWEDIDTGECETVGGAR